MTPFERICKANGYDEQPIEDVRNPYADDIQDTWVRFLAAVNKRGELPQAQTADELIEAFADNAGLLVVKKRQTEINNAYKVKGRVDSNKRTYYQATRSIEQMQEKQEFDSIEDTSADRGFARIDAIDEIMELFETATPSERRALRRFIAAWLLQERGEPIPRALAQQLSVDRKKFRFGFSLRKGR
jgi:hypothetical protein